MRALRRHWGKALLGVAALGIASFLGVRALRGPAVPATAVRRAAVVQTVLVSGRVLPPAEVELTARVESPVRELLADEGDAVEAGAVLARLDRTQAEAEVARAEAALARARASSGRSRRIAPQVAREQLERARVQRAEARRAYEQAERLVDSGAWPEERRRAAGDALSRAESAERAARLELSAARGVDRRAARAAVGEAEAQLALAQERLAYTTVGAPVAGVVLDRRVETGDTVQPGAPLFVLAADGPPILSVEPDERYLSELEVGQRAEASADAWEERPFDARVTFIAPSVDPERGTVEVRLLPTGEAPPLRPNMTVSVEIVVGRAEGALVVPAALVHDAATDEPWVWVAEDGRLARRSVRLGVRGDEAVEVAEGLAEGERVLGVEDPRLAAGARVRVEAR
ncbi:MAG TPA: efflux RND transporter periplasmic adaptor subunit [Sandaracinaceae bacterium LLY-WYZ-13_1]|nr:efflux RND transporter periplasmic adaptor subunit [Sandaracinaceae bacterium LLY-WYZ-13_1]